MHSSKILSSGICIILLLSASLLHAQFPGGNKGNFKQMNVGHFYGKVVDAKTNKPVSYATLQLFQNKMDTVTHAMKRTLVTGALTEENGDFSMENLPVFGQFTLRVTSIGYDSLEEKVAFDLPKNGGGNMQQMMNAVDKDLGNIKLNTSATELEGVTVSGDEPALKLQLDKKVYSVDKNPVAAGGTAEDVLKQIPSVTVDIDDNVTMRNAAPQIFVDGRPTTLSIDQIPADAIDKVELITNPSAKYDASGGQSGIINIVLKKSRRIGYNGNLRAGIDMRARINAGGDINLRQNKINVFAGVNFNQRKSIVTNHTERDNFTPLPQTNLFQNDTNINKGYFGFGNLGFDYFMNNRNTLTVSGTLMHGSFDPVDTLFFQTDTLLDSGTSSSYGIRNTNNQRDFKNLGGAISFKHLFPKEDEEWTADANYGNMHITNNGLFVTQYVTDQQVDIGAPQQQQQVITTGNQSYTLQTDFSDPVLESSKMEAGARAAIRNFTSENHVSVFDDTTQEYIEIPDLNSYTYNDQVYAAYGTWSSTIKKKWQYQLGLRMESSFYTGTLTGTGLSFTNNYPLSLFPSGFATYQFNDNNSLQLSYTRRIDRPNFFQLIPFTDYSDSLNLSKGNPDLQPQFTHSVELNYEKDFDQKNNLLFSAYFKQTNNLITRYQLQQFDTLLQKTVIVTTYENASSAQVYGLEITSSNTLAKWLSLTTDVNIFNSTINGSNIESGLSNTQFSWLAKENATIKLPLHFTIQLTGDYQSKTSVPQSSGGGGGMGRGMGGFGGGMGGNTATVQGYINPIYGMDAAIKYEFLKNKAASVTLSGSDLLRTRRNETISNTDFFTQTTLRQRDPQFFRLTFALKFGKFDASLFKRKSMPTNDVVPDMGGM